jgi:DNA primase
VTKIFRLVDRVIFAFDGDAAGRKAAWRGLENSLPQLPDGKQVSFLFLPEGEDPDSYVRDHGAEAFRALCQRAKPLSDYLFETLRAQTDMASQEGRVRLVTLVEPYIGRMGNAPLLARALRARLAEQTGVAPPADARRDGRRDARERPPSRREVLASPYRVVIQGLLEKPARVSDLACDWSNEGSDAAVLNTLVAYLREHPEMDKTRDIVDAFRGGEVYAALRDASAALLAGGEEGILNADFLGALVSLRVQWAECELQRLNRVPLDQLGAEDRQQLLKVLKYKKLDEVARVRDEKSGA